MAAKKSKSFTIVGQGGGMTAAYHVGVIKGLQKRYQDKLKYLDRIVASSGAAAIYTYLVSGQTDLQEPIFDYLFDSDRFVIPKRWPPGKHMMDIDFMVDNAMHQAFPLDVNALADSTIDFEVGVTDALTGKAKYINKKSPEAPDIYELIRASCMVPFFSGEAVKLGNNQVGFRLYLDGSIGSVASLEDIKDDKNVLIVLTRPLEEPTPKKMTFRKVAAWLLMRNRPEHLQSAIWGMMTQVNKLPRQITKMRENRNLVVIEPTKDLPMWRIEVRPDGKDRLHRVIEQGYSDVMDHSGLDEFFANL